MRRPLGFLLTLLFAVGLAVGFSACGDDDTSGGKTLRFAHFWSEPTQRSFLVARLDSFRAQNPGVEIELIDLSWDDGKQKLFAMFDGNQTPDVIELGSDWVAQFAESGRLHAFDPNPASNVPPGLAAPGIWNGTIYARPWVVASRGLFINEDLLRRAGVDPDSLRTWESVLEAAEQVNRANLGDGIVGLGVNGSDPNRLFKKVLPLIWTNGGFLFDEEGNPTLNRPENVQALDFYLTLGRNGRVDSQKELDQRFLSGRVAIWLSGPWLVDRIEKENPDLAYSVHPMPSYRGNPGIGIIGGEYLAVNRDSEHLALAVRLVDFLTSGEQALAFSKDLRGGYAPADLTGEGDPYLNEGHQKAFTSQLRTGRMTPVVPRWLEIQNLFEEAVVRAQKGEATAQEALDQAQAAAAK